MSNGELRKRNEEYLRGYRVGYKKGYGDAKRKYERPTGEWIKNKIEKTIFFCSECGREIDTKPFTRPDNFPFCHCGADMRKGCEE